MCQLLYHKVKCELSNSKCAPSNLAQLVHLCPMAHRGDLQFQGAIYLNSFGVLLLPEKGKQKLVKMIQAHQS